MTDAEVAQLIRDAVKLEREACAAIADDYVRDALGVSSRYGLHDEQKGRVEAGEKIAGDIRARSQTNGAHQ